MTGMGGVAQMGMLVRLSSLQWQVHFLMPYTLTTPLYYLNDRPHLGSTYTTLAAGSVRAAATRR